MAKALRDNRKTETRRMRGLDEINQNPDKWKFQFFDDDIACFVDFAVKGSWSKKDGTVISIKSPFKIGPCWVRETFSKIHYEGVDEKPTFFYKADDNTDVERIWKPSIHMPFIVAREFIHIDYVRPERLQEITEEGAIAEGVEKMFFGKESVRQGILTGEHTGWKNYGKRDKLKPFLNKQFARQSFESLITSINGPECWEKNMWVWVIKFHRISKPN